MSNFETLILVSLQPLFSPCKRLQFTGGGSSHLLAFHINCVTVNSSSHSAAYSSRHSAHSQFQFQCSQFQAPILSAIKACCCTRGHTCTSVERHPPGPDFTGDSCNWVEFIGSTFCSFIQVSHLILPPSSPCSNLIKSRASILQFCNDLWLYGTSRCSKTGERETAAEKPLGATYLLRRVPKCTFAAVCCHEPWTIIYRSRAAAGQLPKMLQLHCCMLHPPNLCSPPEKSIVWTFVLCNNICSLFQISDLVCTL